MITRTPTRARCLLCKRGDDYRTIDIVESVDSDGEPIVDVYYAGDDGSPYKRRLSYATWEQASRAVDSAMANGLADVVVIETCMPSEDWFRLQGGDYWANRHHWKTLFGATS